jgi:hypothetical protein
VSLDNAKAGQTLTVEHLQELPMVLTDLLPKAFTTVVKQMHVEDFTVVPFLVAGSDRIGILQERPARLLAPAA